MTALRYDLSGLTDREGISDAISRCVTGLDLPDIELFKSAFTGDAVFDLNGKTQDGLDAIIKGTFDFISKLVTTHSVTSVRADIDGSRASVTASAIAQHYRAGEGFGGEGLLAGSLYSFEMVKEEVWKIKEWKLKLLWTQGDQKVVMP